MVVKMIKWSPWPPASTAAVKKFQVKAKGMKLEGFFDNGNDEREKVMAVEIRWEGGPKPGLVPFPRSSSKRRRKQISNEISVKKSESIVWGDEFENTCSFPIAAKENTFGPWELSFTVLYGAKTETKLAVIGKASVNLGEMASKREALIEATVPVNFVVAGVAGEATLSVCLSFVEVSDSQDSAGIVQNSTESKDLKGAKGDGLAYDKDRLKGQKEVSSDDSDESAIFDSEVTSDNELVSMTNGVDVTTVPESGLGLSSETQWDSVKKAGFFSWKRRRLSFKPVKTKGEPLIQKTKDADHVDSVNSDLIPEFNTTEPSCKPGEKEETNTTGHWEEKQLISRDGESKLKTNVFFASFDQRSDKAAGESACTALVAVIAHWLHSNVDEMPTRSEFDQLIVEGSSEWRNLCKNEVLINQFPNKHFDLETVVQTSLRPIAVLPDESFVGFFGPDKFESLKGFFSFDQIWDEIKNVNGDARPRVYIVSWNDHFFVLKVDSDAYYIIDTLGERLYEGCDRAYILRFDDTTLMHGKVERERVGSIEPTNSEEDSEEEICRGKECCREFIKRFFAAIPLKDLELEEEKEPVSYFALHHRLQIEFNLSSSSSPWSSSSSSLATSSASAIFSDENTDS